MPVFSLWRLLPDKISKEHLLLLIAYEISLIMPRHLVSEQLHQHSQYYVFVDSQSYGSCSLERLKKEGSWTTLGLEFNMQLVESLRYLTCGVGCPFWGMVMGKRTTKPKNSMSQPRHVIVLSWSAT